MKPLVLIVDDDESLRSLLCEQLDATERLRVLGAENAERALAIVNEHEVSAVVSDLRMPGSTGTELCREIVRLRPDIPVVIMTAFGSMDTAVDAIRAGAYDYLTKPFEPEQLELVLNRALEDRRLREEVRRLRRQTRDTAGFAGMIGTSAPMEKLYSLIDRIASSEASVMIEGESGTGKELVARALHQSSRRREAPFVALNCAAVPDHLLESELFGQEPGAFTDAKAARVGLMREAQGGTVFLDEVGDLSAVMQPKLLRALQERRIRPVGSDTEVSLDVRVIAATHKDLRSAISSGQFRTDLYYRLNVITVHVPPLRARGDDILLLADTFLEEIAARDGCVAPRLDEEAASLMTRYSWPGNVRELRNCVERCVALNVDGVVSSEHLPEEIREQATAVPVVQEPSAPSAVDADANSGARMVPLAEVEKRHILRVLAGVDGNKSKAAQVLGIDRKTLHARLLRYDYDG